MNEIMNQLQDEEGQDISGEDSESDKDYTPCKKAKAGSDSEDDESDALAPCHDQATPGSLGPTLFRN